MKHLRRVLWAVLALGFGCVVIAPNFIGCGGAWLTVRVRATDATTHKPIPAATVMMITDERTKTQNMRVSPPTVLTGLTDNGGYATLKDMFGAGFDKYGTSLSVGTSSVRCEAVGYAPAEVRVSPEGRLRFYNFLIYKQPSNIELTLSLTR
ncbi:hypothetical protein BH11VER1_BH11VER1_30780 [soil metagenome]